MNPVTHEQEFLQYQVTRLIEQQGKTNDLLNELLKHLSQSQLPNIQEVIEDVNTTKVRRNRSKASTE